ncbi:2-oxoglutarate and iron-dependent oxygenase JMJD4 isoform X2 [Nematostella vectensis]|uniref:2-oxoglutarate and iron-dependent oxygenase JMJD4 isoform X2 n=1 Tax=Nematostella vectensis TaxID=45351 RepID=UPI00207763C8|nr:2-oxoglutarate and iron-dependent oxygenase JMJD4 isoform X2 [Nematostella vectensis]
MADDVGEFPRVGKISYEAFLTDYLQPNKLCVFSCELTQEWKCRKEWVVNGEPNFEFLHQNFGNAIAPVADCNQECNGNHSKDTMSIAAFLEYWRKRRDVDAGHKAYTTPECFSSDWLNEFWDQREDECDDYRFVYMGPKGTWTPFHADVFRSYSWSANICGSKKWIIFPPAEERYFYDKLGNLAYDITSEDLRNPEKFPNAAKAKQPIVILQKEGEVIFIPSGWFHQVHNMEDTISINHNWTNAYGLMYMWKHIQDELFKVKQSIEDCKDMPEWHLHCQVMLRAISGIHYHDFVQFLAHIAKPRMACIKVLTQIATMSNEKVKETVMGRLLAKNPVFLEWVDCILNQEKKRTFLYKYCLYDILQISKCLSEVKEDTSFMELDDNTLLGQVLDILTDIEGVLCQSGFGNK